MNPMSFGEILDGAFVLLRRHFAVLIGIAVVCQGIPALLDVYIDVTGGPTVNAGLNLLDRLLTLVGGVFVTGATVRVVSEAYLGRDSSLGEAISFAGSRFGTIFGANFYTGLLTVLATIAFVIPGIVVACGYSVAAVAAALESGSGIEAARRSWALTKGFKSKAFGLGVVSIGLILVIYLAAAFMGGVVAGLLGGRGLDWILAVLAALLTLLFYPVLSCVFTLFYYDLRVRKEGFDLEMLSRQLDAIAG